MRGRVRATLILSFAAITLLFGCAADAVFIGDLALMAVADPQQFEREIVSAGREAGSRVQVVWQSTDTLGDPWLDSVVSHVTADIVILSPYFSAFASDLGSRLPETQFVAFYGPDTGPENVFRVRFDANDAMDELGAYLGEWVFAQSGRSVSALAYATDSASRSEFRVLAESYREDTGLDLDSRSFESLPDRDQVRISVERIVASGEHLVVAFLGSATSYALEALLGHSASAIVRHGVGDPSGEGGIHGVVQDDLSSGVRAALRALSNAEPGRSVTVPSVLRLAADAVR
jgi:hypothetical protein